MNRFIFNTALATSLARLFGFIRTSFLGAVLGTSVIADSLFLAFKIPNMFRRILAEGAMHSGFIPIFSSLKEHDTDTANNRWSFLISVSFFLVGICGIVTLLGIFFSRQLIELFCIFSNYSVENIEQTTTMLQIMFPFLWLICIAAILQSVLNTYHIFTLPALAPILSSTSVIVGCYWIKTASFPLFYTAKMISIFVLIGGLLQMCFLLFWFWHFGYLRKIWASQKSINSHHIWGFTMLLIPSAISNSIYHFGSLIVDPLALSLEAGSFAALQYSIRLQELPLGVLMVSITTVYLPLLSQTFTSQKEEVQQDRIEEIFSITMLLITPCIAIALLFYKEIVSVVYQGGLFSQASLEITSDCFFYHAVAILPISCNRVLISIYQAYRNTKIPAKLAFTYLPIEIFLAFFLCYYVSPHPRSIAIAALVGASLYSLLLVKNLPTLQFATTLRKKLFIKFSITFLAAIFFVVMSKMLFNSIFLDKAKLDLFDYTTFFSTSKMFLFCRLFFSSLCVYGGVFMVWHFLFPSSKTKSSIVPRL